VPRRSRDLERIFSLQFERRVNRDNTVSFQNLSLQIERVRWRATLAGCQVVVHQHLDGTLSLTHGPHCLGRYTAQGGAIETNHTAARRALLGGIRLDEAAIYRQILAPHQPHFHALAHDLLEQLLKQLRLLKPSVPVLGERRMMRDLLIEAEPGEPAPRQMHAQFLHQPALAGDAVQITDQQNAQQQLRINRRPTRLTVAVFQLLPDELEADVLVDQPQQMMFGNLIFQTEVVEQRF
jgi:hypothetical protein